MRNGRSCARVSSREERYAVHSPTFVLRARMCDEYFNRFFFFLHLFRTQPFQFRSVMWKIFHFLIIFTKYIVVISRCIISLWYKKKWKKNSRERFSFLYARAGNFFFLSSRRDSLAQLARLICICEERTHAAYNGTYCLHYLCSFSSVYSITIHICIYALMCVVGGVVDDDTFCYFLSQLRAISRMYKEIE